MVPVKHFSHLPPSKINYSFYPHVKHFEYGNSKIIQNCSNLAMGSLSPKKDICSTLSINFSTPILKGKWYQHYMYLTIPCVKW